MARVVVGLSGGVDSSVAAYLLQEQGYEVIGLFMKNWHDESVTLSSECPWIDDSLDALQVAENLGIPFQTIDLSKDYKQRVVDYMFAEYERGRTPNPDVLCNREIKFDIFLKTALQLGADYVATGHYCQKKTVEHDGKTYHRLLAGADTNKDQSYFLCQLNQYQLSKALFPIGHLQKADVRAIATQLGLVTADKKDSQGICFVGKVKLPVFLQQQLAPKKGKVIEIPAHSSLYERSWATAVLPSNTGSTHEPASQDYLVEHTQAYAYQATDGVVRGEHEGAHFYTIGQRKGLNIGGSAKPLFVLAIDVQNNLVYTGQGEAHPGLYRMGLFVDKTEIHWVRPDMHLEAGEQARYQVRIRYRQPLEWATLYQQADGLYMVFDKPQRGVASGQFVAWYADAELLGSGVISV